MTAKKRRNLTNRINKTLSRHENFFKLSSANNNNKKVKSFKLQIKWEINSLH